MPVQRGLYPLFCAIKLMRCSSLSSATPQCKEMLNHKVMESGGRTQSWRDAPVWQTSRRGPAQFAPALFLALLVNTAIVMTGLLAAIFHDRTSAIC